MARKPRIPEGAIYPYRIRQEDLAEFQRIEAENPDDPRLWEMMIPLFGWEDEPEPEGPPPDEPKPV
jgi:hypothetical protein